MATTTPKPASSTTVHQHADLRARLPFGDTQDFAIITP